MLCRRTLHRRRILPIQYRFAVRRNFAHALRNFAANAVTRNQNCLHIGLPLSKKRQGCGVAVAVYPALPDCFLPVGPALTQDKPAKS